jgi:hypothetical protein
MDGVRRVRGGHAKQAADVSFRLLIALLLQYGLGISYNLYGTVPTSSKSIGFFSSPLLALHVILGTLVVLTAIYVVVLSVRARMRFPVIASSLALACLLGAWASGSEFTQKGQTGFSMAMAMLTGVALLCTAINIRMLSAPSSK